MLNIPRFDIIVRRGDSEEKLIRFKKGGAPFDLSVVERIDMHVKVDSKVVLKISTSDNSIRILDRAGGEILLNIKPELTALKKFSTGEYDVQFIYASKRIKTVLEGDFILASDVTYIKG